MREINEAIEKEKIEQMGEVRSKEREREIIHRDRTGKVNRRRKRRKWRREREKCGKIKKKEREL